MQSANPAIIAPPTQARDARSEFMRTRRPERTDTRHLGSAAGAPGDARGQHHLHPRGRPHHHPRRRPHHHPPQRVGEPLRHRRSQRPWSSGAVPTPETRSSSAADGIPWTSSPLPMRKAACCGAIAAIRTAARSSSSTTTTAGFDRPVFIDLPPPLIRIPRERYILDAGRARPEDIYEVFMEPPVEQIDQRYTLDQVRFNAPLRDRMPRVDLDVTFETGSWQRLGPDPDRAAGGDRRRHQPGDPAQSRARSS